MRCPLFVELFENIFDFVEYEKLKKEKETVD